MNLTIRNVLGASIFFAKLFYISNCYACVCASDLGMANPELVFVGIATARTKIDEPSSGREGYVSVIRYSFTVKNIIKGQKTTTAEIETLDTDCAAIFELGRSYRVLAKRFSEDKLHWYTNQCSGNKRMDESKETGRRRLPCSKVARIWTPPLTQLFWMAEQVARMKRSEIRDKFVRWSFIDAHTVLPLDDARAETQRWMPIYNEQRSHRAIGHLPPMVFKLRWQERQSLLSSGSA